MNLFYILKDKKLVPCDAEEYGKWMKQEWENFHEAGKSNVVVAKTNIDDIEISTVFLGIDHGFSIRNKAPIIFETMIFNGVHDQEMRRYCTWDEALKGHEEMVKMVTNTCN